MHPIAAILNERGMIHRRFAERLGLSGPDLSHILAGRRPEPEGFYDRAAELLQVPVVMLTPDRDREPAAA